MYLRSSPTYNLSHTTVLRTHTHTHMHTHIHTHTHTDTDTITHSHAPTRTHCATTPPTIWRTQLCRAQAHTHAHTHIHKNTKIHDTHTNIQPNLQTVAHNSALHCCAVPQYTNTIKLAHLHTCTQTHRHTDTQTHRHTHTNTHTNTGCDTQLYCSLSCFAEHQMVTMGTC